MLDTKVAELLNTQVNKEFYSAYLYLDFSNYYMDQGLEGFANWYKIQAQEERDHALLFMQYLQNNGCKVTLDAIDRPDKELKEQGEEETNAEGLIKKYDLFGSDPRALYMLDNELGARVYSAPSLVL